MLRSDFCRLLFIAKFLKQQSIATANPFLVDRKGKAKHEYIHGTARYWSSYVYLYLKSYIGQIFKKNLLVPVRGGKETPKMISCRFDSL